MVGGFSIQREQNFPGDRIGGGKHAVMLVEYCGSANPESLHPALRFSAWDSERMAGQVIHAVFYPKGGTSAGSNIYNI